MKIEISRIENSRVQCFQCSRKLRVQVAAKNESDAEDRDPVENRAEEGAAPSRPNVVHQVDDQEHDGDGAPARSTWIEVSSSLIRASAAGIEEETAAVSRPLSAAPRFCVPKPSAHKVLRAPRLTQVSRANEFQRAPHRIEREIHLVIRMLSGGASRTTFSAFSVQLMTTPLARVAATNRCAICAS